MLNSGYYLGSYVQYISERAYKSYLMYIILPNSSLSKAVYFIFSSEGARKASITRANSNSWGRPRSGLNTHTFVSAFVKSLAVLIYFES